MPDAPDLQLKTDGQLAAEALAGSREAMGVLAARHYAGVTAVVYRLTADAQFAEDAAQEALLRAWTRLDSFDPGRSANPQHAFRNWLYRIASNYALDVLRRQPQRLPLEAAETASERRGVEEGLLQREQKAEVQAAVQRAVLELPPASRAVLVLREYEGLSYREIAEVLELPLGTVMSRLNYARRQLRERLQSLEPAGSPAGPAAPQKEGA